MEETVQVRYEISIHVLTYYNTYVAQILMNVLIMFLVVIKSAVILLEVMFVAVSLDSLLVVIIGLVLVSLSLCLSYNNYSIMSEGIYFHLNLWSIEEHINNIAQTFFSSEYLEQLKFHTTYICITSCHYSNVYYIILNDG